MSLPPEPALTMLITTLLAGGWFPLPVGAFAEDSERRPPVLPVNRVVETSMQVEL